MKQMYLCMVLACFLSSLVQSEPIGNRDALAVLQTLSSHEKSSSKSFKNTQWCCQIDPPSIPIFTSTGHFSHYETQACPVQYVVCCKGYINILGYCITLQDATAMLPIWQSLASSLNISLAEAILQSGTLVG